MAASPEKTAVLLLAMGGPESPEQVREYLIRVFSDRSLIRLPGGPLLQAPVARLIARARTSRVRKRYELIGGGSPLRHWTAAQADAIKQHLVHIIPKVACFVGMRYHYPLISEAVTQAVAAGVTRLICLPMYPQYCRATTGSSFAEVQRVTQAYANLSVEFIRDFHDHPTYVDLLQTYITSHTSPQDHLVFSAHAVPQQLVAEGDPYVDQIHHTAALVAGSRPYTVSFQSRTGPVRWVGPDSLDVMRQLLSRNGATITVIPISFVCDHIETLYDIDIEWRRILGQEADSRWRRLPMFNDDTRFAEVLAKAVIERLTQYADA